MPALTHRERVLKALNHEEPDLVPTDLGGASVTTTNIKAYTRLVKYLGIEEDPATLVTSKRSMTAVPSERVLQLLDVDARGLTPGGPDLRPDEDIDETAFIDEWGVLWKRPEGGHFINTGGPFQQMDEPTVADLEKYDRWPDPRDPGRVRGLREKARKLHEETDYAIVFQLPYAIVRECQRMRGFGEWLADLLAAPAFAEGLMEHALEVSAGIALATLEEVGDYVDVVIFPDDLGIQDMCYVRPELYRKAIKPYHRRLVEAIKTKTTAKVLIHSDGSVYAIIGDLIDIGVDVLNPVQVSAKDMDTRRLKREFGAYLSFWGAIDTHRVLPRGTPEQVRAEVRTRIDDLAKGGGYVVASVHNIQAEVPPENILAMFQTAREYGVYN
ncbi:MAG: uroporphyrinogen decarboxylase family protein [Candidatus Binatia bacterium]